MKDFRKDESGGFVFIFDKNETNYEQQMIMKGAL